MEVITITIPGEMRGKGRPRFSGRGGFVRAYTDHKTASAETWVRACAVEQAGMVPLAGPISLSIAIAVEVPASWPKKKRADALNGIVWRDDKQIIRMDLRKHYAERAQTVLTVAEV